MKQFRKILPFIAIGISLIYAIALVIGGSTLLGAAWIALGILLTILAAVIAMMAGMLVIKALFVVAAEVSLLIFLTQSYCAVPGRLPQNNNALRTLFTIGALYILFIFGQSLWEVLKERYQKLEGERGSLQRTVTVLSFILFVGLFLWDLYLVVSPIIWNLCVYR